MKTDVEIAAEVTPRPIAEIAEVQAVPLGTAKTRLFHARRKLKAALSGDDP